MPGSSAPAVSLAARTVAIAVAAVCAAPVVSAAAPVLRRATLEAAFTTATSCEVTAAFTIAGDSESPVEHRLHTGEGATVELLDRPATAAMAAPEAGGRANVLHVPLSESETAYVIRYRVAQGDAAAYRCPLWLPTVPTDGRSRDIQIRVTLPSGAEPAGGGFPMLQWSAGEAMTTLGHVPTFVHVPFHRAGETSALLSWDIRRVMDATALVLLAIGMIAFAWRRKRR
jgi:hypothetical protein